MLFMMMGKYPSIQWIFNCFCFVAIVEPYTNFEMVYFPKSLPVSVLMSASSGIANNISALPTVLVKTSQ